MPDINTIVSLLDAVQSMGASDVFLSEGKPPSARINGAVRRLKHDELKRSTLSVFFELVLSEKQSLEFNQTGDFDVGYSLPSGQRFRINLSKQQGLLSMVARILPSGDLDMDDLLLPKEELKSLASEHRGIILVTGATGSGKSTTLASLIHYINQTKRSHIVTIEDPIEFTFNDERSRISQREVGSDTNSFHEALRRVVRQSPDVIMIGEMRDRESIDVAMSAALTGHLVLSTIHTIDATQTLQRIMSFYPEEQRSQVAVDLSLSLKGIVSQRLVPMKDGNGRAPAVELLKNTPAVAQLLREQRYGDLEDLMRDSRKESIQTFNMALLRLYNKSLISQDIALSFSSNPDELQLLLQGMATGNMAYATVGKEHSTAGTPDIQKLLRATLDEDGSDLHLTVGRPPMIRVRGELKSISKRFLSATDLRVLLNSVMNARQRMAYELEREVDFSLGLQDGRRFRVNAYFQRGHMAAAMRAIPSHIPEPSSMGIPSSILELVDKPHGLLMVVGPTGSGKSTTLACMIDRINKSRRCRIITVEDPIEFTHRDLLSSIDQREVYTDTKSFSAALKYILRQDPDVILVGEMRDQETISAALTASETGHLVLATLHTNDAVQTIDRIVDVFPASQQDQIRAQLSSSLLAVVSQRLLKSQEGGRRVPAFEIMTGTTAIRAMIRDNKMHQAHGMIEASQSFGMITMDKYLKNLLEEGIISEDEAMRYAKHPLSVSISENTKGATDGEAQKSSRYRYR